MAEGWPGIGGEPPSASRPGPYLSDDAQDPSDPLCGVEAAGVGAHSL